MQLVRATLTYFPLWAKGPASALALSHSGLSWSGVFPSDWGTLKPTTPWSKLPLLNCETTSSPLTISHELAILNTIGTVSPAMSGATNADWATSQQLMCEADDIYAKLTKYQPTTNVKDKCEPEELEKLWTPTPDLAVHNREQGLHCNLALIDRFGGATTNGKYTDSGTSVGECKLFATLHALVLIDDGVLKSYPKLGAFYERFGEQQATREVLETGANMPGKFNQYFVAE